MMTSPETALMSGATLSKVRPMFAASLKVMITMESVTSGI